MRVVAVVLALTFAFSSYADLLVSVREESSLPYEFSPSNYENSPSNYANSVSNYENSPSNYANSESNYANSSSNYANGAGGERRLILEEDGQSYRVGYYVRADSGVINFFSVKGKRLFYSAAAGSGVFHGKSGFFCGVLARVGGELQLVLTEAGERVLLLGE